MRHPRLNISNFDTYEDYKLALAEWQKSPWTASKINSRAAYITEIEKQQKEKKDMTTFNIKKRDNAPDFVVGSFGCKLGDLEPYVNSKGYINFDILKGKENGMYVKINEYDLNNKEENVVSISDDEISF